MKKSVTVITPTVGSSKLKDAIQSVSIQTYENIKHLIVVDGPIHFQKTLAEIKSTKFDRDVQQVTCTPENTGANGYNGQRIYAAYPHLVNSEYIAFLDEDNWFEPDHILNLVSIIESSNLDWSYSLRKIFDVNKNYVDEDNCESLGKWPIFYTYDNPEYLIDTSCYLFTKSFIEKHCHLWHSGAWGEDRRFLQAIRNISNWNTTGKHSLCYRLDGNSRSVRPELFFDGNAINKARYNNILPWVKK
jgi:glycosyltransferase involved in cell wall biosynthesis